MKAEFTNRTASGALLLLCAACTGEAAPPGERAEPSLLEPPAHGVQYVTASDIEAGAEGELCAFVKAPEEGMIVNRDEVRFTDGVHHFLVYQTAYGDIPDENDLGVPVDTSAPFDCSEGPTVGWTITGLLGGSQTARGESTIDLPEHVGIRIPPGAVLLMNAHYLNTRDEAVRSEVAVNFHTIEEGDLQIEGGFLFWYDVFIHVPPMERRSAGMTCKVHSDLTLVNAQSHMHKRGVGYVAELVHADTSEPPEVIYETDDWQDVLIRKWDEGLAIRAGSSIRYSCDYVNEETREVFQGPTSRDEMCMLVGTYYPKDDVTGLCAEDESEPARTRWFGATWHGQGSASCAESLTCLTQAGPEALDEASRCIANTSPAAGEALSAVVRCMMTAGDDPVSRCAGPIAACGGGL